METQPDGIVEAMTGLRLPLAVALGAAVLCAVLTWFAPSGDSALLVPALLFPWAVGVVVAVRPESMSMFFETARTPMRAPIGLAAEMVSFLVFVNAFARFNIDAPLQDIATPALIVGGVLWAFFLAVDRGARAPAVAILFLVSSVAYGYGATLFANERFATAPVTMVEARVLDSARLAPSKAGRSPTFYLEVEQYGLVPVRPAVWGSHTKPGGTVCVRRRVGALGFTSFDVDLCPKQRPTPTPATP